MSTDSSLRVFTCTPVRFQCGRAFFSRDSGLLSAGFRQIGKDSRPVVLGPPRADDEPEVIRASLTSLSNTVWWKDQRLDSVVLFSWAMPKFTPIAEAIKNSGAKLLLFLDSAGFWSPWSNGTDWFKVQLQACKRKYDSRTALLRFAGAAARSCMPWTFDIPRLKQMQIADAVAVTSPLVHSRTVNYAQHYGFKDLQKRIHCIPLPVSGVMRYTNQRKIKRVICVARWLPEDWPEKCPLLLLKSLSLFLQRRPDYEAIVVGRGAPGLRNTPFFPKALNERDFHLIDFQTTEEIRTLLARARISICSSLHESFHIASYEAACCGASIVALKSPDLPALQLLCSRNGTLASDGSPEAFSDALLHEAELWDQCKRHPHSISANWVGQTAADRVAQQCLRVLQLS